MADKKTLKDWEAAVEKQTKGAGADSLVWHTPEGIDVKALYTAEDLEKLAAQGYDANTLPGFEPYTWAAGLGASTQAPLTPSSLLQIREYPLFTLLVGSNVALR
jgi:methylmalonyl-CoA mutase